MQNTITLSGKEIVFKLHAGHVIHANKYSEARGGWGSLPVTSVLHTEVVVKLTNGDNLNLYMRRLDLPVYNGQEVSLLSANGSVVALIDLKSKKYYYTATNFQKKLGLGIPAYWVWAIGIVCGGIAYLINKNGATFLLMPFIVWIQVLINQWLFNKKLRKEINSYLSA